MLKQTKWLAVLLAAVLMLGSCAQVGGAVLAARVGMPAGAGEVAAQPETAPGLSASAAETHPAGDEPAGEYREGTVLVKYDGEMTDHILDQLGLVSAERLWSGSEWYTVTIGETRNTRETVAYLRELGCFAQVDYDYIMKGDGEVTSVDVSSNPEYTKQEGYLDTLGVGKAWNYIRSLGKHPGGSADVVVAVIDTGVDYSHPDLQNNIWINSGEIPGNGIDDDGNGYVDDVYGWNFVGGNNDPMDDNGHGTHVAGIVAMENNAVGGVGVAYNSKVMVLKAGNSSGYFNNSDIAEAIQYAYMNGASVINMSFGGSMISLAVEEALQMAYNSCVLVAAAGNDGLCNQIGCSVHPDARASYPAALPYVIGVMSCDALGLKVSSFSNYDHYPYNGVEYETFACGEMVFSTWTNGKYALLSGTSMAAPTVAGIAAVLRAAYPDRNTYSTKYLQSQIVNTGSLHPYNSILKACDDSHSVANVYEAMTKLPTPDVNLYDYRIDDSTDISPKNNGNGVMDAGETVRLYVSLQNRGGVASNVQVTLDTLRMSGQSDPYFTLLKDRVVLSDIGTYSVREAEGEQYFEIEIHADCPNDYLADFNLHFTYSNGMIATDETVFSGEGTARFNVSSGYHLPTTINEDTVFEATQRYIVGEDVIIPAGVTVTFKEGCEIQFYDDREYYNSPQFIVYGTLNLLGTKEKMVTVEPSKQYPGFCCVINPKSSSNVLIDYATVTNLRMIGAYDDLTTKTTINNSRLLLQSTRQYIFKNGGRDSTWYLFADKISNCYVEFTSFGGTIRGKMMIDNIFVGRANLGSRILCDNEFSGNYVNSFYRQPGGEYHNNSLFKGRISDNYFYCCDEELKGLLLLDFSGSTTFENNTFSAGYQKYASQVIKDYIGSDGKPKYDVTGSCSDISALYPHITDVAIFNKGKEQVTTIGKEPITVRVTFNRAMDTTKTVYATFGTRDPYGDYRIDGKFISDTVWEGTYTLKAYIENGLQKLIVHGACAAEDATKEVHGEYQPYEFNIDTTAAMSMNLTALPDETGIHLTWNQDDYATLMGYNLYRCDTKNGNYVRINPSVLLASEESFLDTNAEPGKTYWYTFTVVLSDFSETAPAGRVSATALDTLAPSLYHTPVNQGYLGNNLVISCTASDNVAVSAVTLFFRAKGTTEWTARTMSRVNDKYSTTVFGSELTADGLEYYILASDGRNNVAKGSEEAPYQVVIKDASLISRLGDVDGDGVISAKDALMILQHIGGEVLLTDDQFRRADLNSDGELSAVEALRILQFINGKVTSLAM